MTIVNLVSADISVPQLKTVHQLLPCCGIDLLLLLSRNDVRLLYRTACNGRKCYKIWINTATIEKLVMIVRFDLQQRRGGAVPQPGGRAVLSSARVEIREDNYVVILILCFVICSKF